MKKFLTFLAAGVLVIIALATLGHIVGLLIGAAVAYWSFRSFLKADALLGKFFWGIIGLIGLSIVLGNFPAIIGVGAIALLYYGYRNYKTKCSGRKQEDAYKSFRSFEDEWDHVMKHY